MKGGRPPHLNTHLLSRLDSNPNESDDSSSSPSQSSPKTSHTARLYNNDNLMTSHMVVASPTSTNVRHTTTTYLVTIEKRNTFEIKISQLIFTVMV